MTHYGVDHWGALIATVLLGILLVRMGRRGTAAGPVSRILALIILAAQLSDPFVDHAYGYLSWQKSLPLELCDLASVAAIVALWKRHQLAFELTYYWGLVGTMQGMFTPTVHVGFPEIEYFRYWVLHIGIILAALYLRLGLGMSPRKFTVWRAWGLAILAAIPVGLIDWLLGANYMYLASKPAYSILNNCGPWPYYILAMIGLLLVGMFILFYLSLALRLITDRNTSG